MVERRGVKPKEAIEAFEKARGHKIERELYLSDLRGDPLPNQQGNSTNAWGRTDNYNHKNQMQFGTYNTDYRRNEGRSMHRHNRHHNHNPLRHQSYARPALYYPHQQLRGPSSGRSYHSHERYDEDYGASPRNRNEYWSSVTGSGQSFDNYSHLWYGYDYYSNTRHSRLPRK